MTVKIFQINDYDFVAARSLEEATTWYAADIGDEADEDARELTKAEMDDLIFTNEELKECPPRQTFRAVLDQMIARSVKFPAFFATTEC